MTSLKYLGLPEADTFFFCFTMQNAIIIEQRHIDLSVTGNFGVYVLEP